MRAWVYPHSVKGRFQRIHRWTGLALQAFLFVTPWVTVAGYPAVQLDIATRRAFLLGRVFTAEDSVFLVLLALLAAFSLFFFTALYGRLWCGYACPQTVFLEEWIRPLEKLIEGERGVRMARDKKGWTWRKPVKWGVFALLAALVAMTFTSWFAGARALWSGGAGSGAYGVVAFLTVVMFFDFAWFREQFCIYLCPYARFQGALTDEGSLAVTYRVSLGEPRRAEGLCIDCNKCVTVCPAGIDIREGFQLECIACARCIDACTGVMGKRGHESLIVYEPVAPMPAVRPRTVAYGALLSALLVAMGVLLATKGELEATVNRAPGTLYTVDADGWIRNTFLLRVSNDSLAPVDVAVAAELQGAELLVPPMHVEAAASGMTPVVVRLPPHVSRDRTLPLVLTVTAGDARVDVATTFKSGG